MIYGKTFEEQELIDQEIIKNKINGIKRFAWFPVSLKTGKMLWLQYYYRYYHGKEFCGKYRFRYWAGGDYKFSTSEIKDDSMINLKKNTY